MKRYNKKTITLEEATNLSNSVRKELEDAYEAEDRFKGPYGTHKWSLDEKMRLAGLQQCRNWAGQAKVGWPQLDAEQSVAASWAAMEVAVQWARWATSKTLPKKTPKLMPRTNWQDLVERMQ